MECVISILVGICTKQLERLEQGKKDEKDGRTDLAILLDGGSMVRKPSPGSNTKSTSPLPSIGLVTQLVRVSY